MALATVQRPHAYFTLRLSDPSCCDCLVGGEHALPAHCLRNLSRNCYPQVVPVEDWVSHQSWLLGYDPELMYFPALQGQAWAPHLHRFPESSTFLPMSDQLSLLTKIHLTTALPVRSVWEANTASKPQLHQLLAGPPKCAVPGSVSSAFKVLTCPVGTGRETEHWHQVPGNSTAWTWDTTCSSLYSFLALVLPTYLKGLVKSSRELVPYQVAMVWM